MGITRAKEKIYLTSTSNRRYFGTEQRPIPSRFVGEIPKELLHWDSYQDIPSEQLSDNGSSKNRSSKSHVNNTKATNNGYQIGEIIMHPIFGKGKVRKIEETIDDQKLTIAFPKHGVKTIVASFEGLKKV